MVRDFKFLQDNDESYNVDAWDGASWIYGRLENLDQYQYDIVVENHYGIRSFLNHFQPNYIVTILSITGPDGRIHDADNCNNGWGFDILNDLIAIQWVRFRN